MAQLPDELFRKGSAGEESPSRPRQRPRKAATVATPDPLPRAGGGISLRATVLLVLVALAAAFGLGRFLWFTGEAPGGGASAATTSTDPANTRAYDGEVYEFLAQSASSSCGEEAVSLVDLEPDTVWTCYGAGQDVRIRFDFASTQEVAGIRLINGNAVDADTFLRQRRITAVQWQFSDGSSFEQGLLTNHSAQEVRIPTRWASWAELTVRTTTEPGDAEPESDAISLTQVEFLAPIG